MSHVLLDSSVFLSPEISALEQAERYAAVERFLERLADLSRLRRTCEFVTFWRDGSLLEVLHELNAYPFPHSLRAMFQYLDPDADFQVEDATTLATALLERSQVLEEEGPIADVVVSGFDVQPALEVRRPAKLLDQLARTAALSLFHIGDGNALQPNVTFALAERTEHERSATLVVDLIARQDGSCEELNKPTQIRMPCYTDEDAFIKSVDVADLWSRKGASEHCIAIFAAQSTGSTAERVTLLLSRVRFGQEFARSAQRLGFLHEPKKIPRLLNACADILIGRSLAQTHALRSGKGPNDPQRKRGSWLAWRHDFDDEFHLHYWKSGDVIEFANVVVHNDMKITV